MKMKKMFEIGMACMLSAAMLAGCGSTGSEEPAPHTHKAAGGWDRNGKEHWQVCECGEKMELAAHTLDESGICSGCGSEVWEFGDGIVDVYTYNADGDLERLTSYDGDEVISERAIEYEYDADGNKVWEKEYDNGRLMSEVEYKLTAQGESYHFRSTSHQEDGSRFVNEFDEEGNIVVSLGYEADGTMTIEERSEYAYTEDGECYTAKTLGKDYITGIVYDCEYNQYGDILSRVKSDTDGVVDYEERYEREYNEEGQRLWEKTYRDGRLVHEIVGYAVVENEYETIRYPETTITYFEDGTKLVSEYGENSEVATETYYKADGAVDRVVRHEYETDEVGNWTYIRMYENERLLSEQEYAIGEEGWNYVAKLTEYSEDGSKLVTEFDEYDMPIDITQYDANGNEIAKG